MQQDVTSPDPTTTKATASGTPIPPPSGKDLHARLRSLVTYVSALATLMSPEAAVALAYGVPSLETDGLVRFLNEHRIAA